MRRAERRTVASVRKRTAESCRRFVAGCGRTGDVGFNAFNPSILADLAAEHEVPCRMTPCDGHSEVVPLPVFALAYGNETKLVNTRALVVKRQGMNKDRLVRVVVSGSAV